MYCFSMAHLIVLGLILLFHGLLSPQGGSGALFLSCPRGDSALRIALAWRVVLFLVSS